MSVHVTNNANRKPSRTAAVWLFLPLFAVVLGCDRGVSRGELGDVIFADPDVPGSKDPYPLPRLEEPKTPPDAKSQ